VFLVIIYAKVTIKCRENDIIYNNKGIMHFIDNVNKEFNNNFRIIDYYKRQIKLK